jgi:hypothetical protein
MNRIYPFHHLYHGNYQVNRIYDYKVCDKIGLCGDDIGDFGGNALDGLIRGGRGESQC